VAASFATATDVIIAEPGARMGFAGPRVIEQTIHQKLPPGFQTAEFLYRRGLVDRVVPRAALRATLARLLAVVRRRERDDPAAPAATIRDAASLPERDAWATVRLARHADRPTTLEYAYQMLDAFEELHGDRAGADCPAVVGGLGMLRGRGVVLIGHQKGHTTRELVEHNFGMASPDGYRKACRLVQLADRLRLPIVTLVDTPGAYPGAEAEERGQAMAIAESLRVLSGVTVPVVAVVTGEGGSGGALALGVANRVLACENAVYSVISPEGCASILWKTATAGPDAAAALRIDAPALLSLGIVDGVVPEPPGGAHLDPVRAIEAVGAAVREALAALDGLSPAELVSQRRARFRAY
jgi:acyl-CoA carboxylase subunit beta